MTTYQPGDLVLVDFPFTSGAGQQHATRPALVILDTEDDDVVVARVTRQTHSTPHDIPITDWRGAGLLAASIVRLHKLATLEKDLIHRRLGSLQPLDRTQVSQAMRQTWGTW
jgi:mRNA interferase MazF